jgi:tRNA modification GTPase
MIHYSDEDIITAIGTPLGAAGIGIVRISGSGSIALADSIFSGKKKKRLSDAATHTLHYGVIHEVDSEKVLDEVLVSVMRAPATYTTQDVVEINCHGGITATRSVLSAVMGAGARIAQPGEFTKRAFLGGRIDLTQAEAVMDIIGAKTKRSLALSVRQLEGDVSGFVHRTDQKLLGLLSDLDAVLDYPEYDVEEVTRRQVGEVLDSCMADLSNRLKTMEAGKILREGIATAIIGAPNVGKSSLLNHLVDEEKAIVTDIPGTTRDTIEEYISIEGIPFRIIDTAGIRTTDDVVEHLGVERSRQMMDQADLILLMLDVSRETSDEEKELLRQIKNRRAVVINNKTDLGFQRAFIKAEGSLDLSLKKEEGLTELRKRMVKLAMADAEVREEDLIITNARQGSLIAQALAQLKQAHTALDAGMPLDILIIDIQDALESLRAITGESIGTDIIDQIFLKFCLGK